LLKSTPLNCASTNFVSGRVWSISTFWMQLLTMMGIVLVLILVLALLTGCPYFSDRSW
jgi:hypothetical protein